MIKKDDQEKILEERKKRQNLDNQKKINELTLELDHLYTEINEGLESSRKTFITSLGIHDELHVDQVRSPETAKQVLDTLKIIQKKIIEFSIMHSNLKEVFEKSFGKLDYFFSRENILETIFLNDFLFETKQKCSLCIDGEINLELVSSYDEFIENTLNEYVELHENSQEIILEKFDETTYFEKLPCKCVSCSGLYKTKLREFILNNVMNNINDLKNWLSENLESKYLDQIIHQVQWTQKKINKDIFRIRYKLKKSSVGKIEKKVKSELINTIGYDSNLGKIYSQKLITYYQSILKSEGLNEDLIDEDEYDRFLSQQGLGIYRSESFLKKEFSKFKRSVLAIKRQDISSTIIKDYIGQFWIHSDARRLNRKIIYHMGPTNSGKTYHAVNALCSASKGCYLAPLRLLAAELFDTMNSKGVKTSLITGEEVIELDGATHFASTIEMAKMKEHFDCVVIDEIQMISDKQRGWAWTRALVNLSADEIHLCGDPSVLNLIQEIVSLTGDSLEVKEYQRMTKLKTLKTSLKLGDLEKADALIVFSRRNALKYKRDLEQLGFKVSIIYGRLGPEVRREQARKFDEGETDVIVSTDAISMGMNLPIKRIVFSTLSKFINNQEFQISPSDIKQIAGRAGRFNRFPTGYVTTLNRVEDGSLVIEEALDDIIDQKEFSMVGPDLDIFKRVNHALSSEGLPILRLSEFLRLFNTMIFQKPFFCVELKEMIEVAEMVESADEKYASLSDEEIFGFSCAPVDLGLMEHAQYFSWILNKYVASKPIVNEPINSISDSIDYLETAIKCVELYQWLSRHFGMKNFVFDKNDLTQNKMKAIEKLNELLSQKLKKTCSSCGVNLSFNHKFNICDECFRSRRFRNFSSKRQNSKFKLKETSKKSDKSNRKKIKLRKRVK